MSGQDRGMNTHRGGGCGGCLGGYKIGWLSVAQPSAGRAVTGLGLDTGQWECHSPREVGALEGGKAESSPEAGLSQRDGGEKWGSV